MVINVDGKRRVKMSGEEQSDSNDKSYARQLKMKTKQKHVSKEYSKDRTAPKTKRVEKPKEVISDESNPIPTEGNSLTSSSSEITEISMSDLEELRSIYNKCKTVINKIETKYGHLLNINGDTSSTEVKQLCQCTANTKIIFDENGDQIVKEMELQNHVCPKKVKRKYSDLFKTTKETSNVQIEYETLKPLPNNLQELTNMLHDPKIEVTHRNHIISKIRSIKQDYSNEIRFNRPSLKEKLKSEPNEVLQFNGANLFALPGYPGKKCTK